MFGFTSPVLLLLLPLAALPFLRHGQTLLAGSSLALLPPDSLSSLIDAALRVLGALCIVTLVLAAAGLYRAEQLVERIGQGAHTVLLLDSSGSMDNLFATGNEHASRAGVWGTFTSKGQVARRLLGQYAAQRPQDMFALFLFSGNPIPVLPLTEKQDVIQAAIAAGSIERGLASTDLGHGLIRSLEFFEGKPFTGSRIVILVSDGAAQLSNRVQDRIKYLLEKHRVTLYWLYLRARFAPGLYADMDSSTAAQVAPEQIVHKFFTETGMPYRAFSAEDPGALEDAIAEVNALQNLPIRYQDIIPRRDLRGWCLAVALPLLVLLLAARLLEKQGWR